MESGVATDGTSGSTVALDLLPTADAVEAMLEGQIAAAAAVQSQVSALASAADAAADRLANSDGRLVYVGAGTSGRLAVLDGTELEPTFGWSPDRLLYGIAGGTAALSASVEGAEDEEEAARVFIASASLTRDDVVIAVSASGTTPYTMAAIREASAAGALTVGIASNVNAPLLLETNHPIFLDTGAELVSGSTRMKAGTAQKIALNLLSTAIMIRLGRVYDGLMVDMRVSNRKLRARAIGIVAQISGVSAMAAESALDRARNDIKIATLVAMGLEPGRARHLLFESGGNLRTTIAGLGGS